MVARSLIVSRSPFPVLLLLLQASALLITALQCVANHRQQLLFNPFFWLGALLPLSCIRLWKCSVLLRDTTCYKWKAVPVGDSNCFRLGIDGWNLGGRSLGEDTRGEAKQMMGVGKWKQEEGRLVTKVK